MKELIERGVDVVGFEKGDGIGGLWVYENTSGLSPAYESLHPEHVQGPHRVRRLPDARAVGGLPAAEKVAGYLQDYADHFGVTEKYLFNTTVTAVERDEDGWTITTDDGEIFELDGVVVANGHNWDPRAGQNPQYPGRFNGEQMHAHDYRKAETFRDQRVLVVGMGNSAMDIAVDASYVADDVMLSARHGSTSCPSTSSAGPPTPPTVRLRCCRGRYARSSRRRCSVSRWQTAGLRLAQAVVRLFQNHPTISDTILHRITHGEVRLVRGIERFDGDSVVFTDGSVEQVDIIVGPPATASPFRS